MQLGEMLVHQGLLSPGDLEEALGWQVLYGGRLGTNLLELGLVEEEALAECLGRQLGCEAAFGTLRPGSGMAALVTPAMARRHECIPWKLEERRLKVLVARPGEQVELLDQLGFRTGRVVREVVAPEFRIHQLLRRHFGSRQPMRSLDFGVRPRTVQRSAPEAEQPAEPHAELMDEAAFHALYARVIEGRSAESTPPPPRARADSLVVVAHGDDDDDLPLLDLELEPIEELPPEAIEPEPLIALDVLQLEEPEPAVLPRPAPSRSAPKGNALWQQFVQQLAGGKDPAAGRPDSEAPFTFEEAMAAVEAADGRDAVARAVLRYARRRAARAVLLSVQGDMALGWHALGEGLSPEAAHRLAVPLIVPSTLQLVRQIRSHYLGPLPKDAGNQLFLRQLGEGWPASALLLPILLRGRITHMLYVDAGAGRHIDVDVGELLILAQRITRSMEELVAKRRAARQVRRGESSPG